jgi:hypothetical protein
MKTTLIYLGSFVIATLAMSLLLHSVSQEGLVWRDALIIGAVFGSLVPFMLWRQKEDWRANRRVWNVLKLVFGVGRR